MQTYWSHGAPCSTRDLIPWMWKYIICMNDNREPNGHFRSLSATLLALLYFNAIFDFNVHYINTVISFCKDKCLTWQTKLNSRYFCSTRREIAQAHWYPKFATLKFGLYTLPSMTVYHWNTRVFTDNCPNPSVEGPQFVCLFNLSKTLSCALHDNNNNMN